MALQKERTKADKISPSEAKKNFNEVNLGYTAEKALQEAARCLICRNKPCTEGCPVNINIPGFIQEITNGNLDAAYNIIQESNSLPAVCGRVCPQEDQCASRCVLGNKFEPVNIGVLERYVADTYKGRLNNSSEKRSDTDRSVGVVGSGPSGLTFAGDMIRSGFRVTVYEALHELGGVLRYGIPDFRLPNEVIDAEIARLKELGVVFKTSFVIGKILTLNELLKMHEAVYIGIGAGLPSFMGIPGENLNGVYSANEYLTRSNLMRSYKYPEYHTPVRVGDSVAVVGGGNVAMDAARSAIRLGAKKVYNIYRRSRKEMPARFEEIDNAEAEGVELVLLTNPVEVIGNSDFDVTAIKCIKMELGEPDPSGRRRPIEIPGSEYEIAADVVVMAIGTGPNRVLLENSPGLELNKWGYITIDENNGETSLNNVFAGGDIVTGAATVISAMGAARLAAKELIQRTYGKEKG